MFHSLRRFVTTGTQPENLPLTGPELVSFLSTLLDEYRAARDPIRQRLVLNRACQRLRYCR